MSACAAKSGTPTEAAVETAAKTQTEPAAAAGMPEESAIEPAAPIDKARLHRLASLRREITRTKQRIAAAERRAGAADGAEAALAAALRDKRDALTHYLRAAEAEEALLVRYIESIPDSDVRELFMLRYVDGVRSWQRIAFLAGEHDESYVRRKHNRYIKKTGAAGKSRK